MAALEEEKGSRGMEDSPRGIWPKSRRLLRHSDERVVTSLSDGAWTLSHSPAVSASSLVDLLLNWSSGVLHIGAHTGQEASRYWHLSKPVIWFEADPDLARQLKENVSKYPNQRVVESCLSVTDGAEVEFRIASNDGASSSLFDFGSAINGRKGMFPELDLKMVRSVKMTTRSLDSLLREARVDSSDFNHWVVDVQGAELLVLQGAEESLLGCGSLVVECGTKDV